MKRDYFINKSYVNFKVISKEISPDEISIKLGISPDKSFLKGETSVSKHSGSVITKIHNLWSISSKTIISEEESISPHLKYLKSRLEGKSEVLKELKDDTRFELSFWVWIETDNAGIGLDLSEEEMSFLTDCSNRVHFSFLTNDEIDE